jgi:hypothetical protein
MKFLKVALLLAAVFAVSIEASTKEKIVEKRFIGAITGWIQDTIINPVIDHVVNPIVDHVVNPVISGVTDHIINPIQENVIDPISAIVNGGGGGQPQPQDLCQATCVKKFNYGQVEEFFYDRPNGCRSKGFPDNTFDSCCDQHNYCLNNQCCTTDCDAKKSACDNQLRQCLRNTCEPLYDDYQKYEVCNVLMMKLNTHVRNQQCKADSTTNRKLCYCNL